MSKLLIALILILSVSGIATAQFPRTLLKQIREIKLLESNRDDVRRVLADYHTSEDNDHFQQYYNDVADIRIHFFDGTCSEDPDDEDDSMIWKVSEWKVTRVEIEPGEAITVADAGFDLSKFMKEQIYRESSSQHIHHDKARGLAIETGEDGVEKIIFFPPSGRSNKLCQGSKMAKEFYSRESWFARKLEDRLVCDWINQHANVEDVILSATEIEATTNKTISVTTVAVDPENDVLTYVYKVTAGQIRETGAQVVWDLTSVQAGTYTIIVGVDDGAGIVGKTISKTVTVR